MPGDAYHSGAWAYDAAFSWDVTDEVDWLLTRLGGDAASVLEPFCGSGRMFPAFVRRGIEIAGIDISPEMLERATQRMRREGLRVPVVHLGDATSFELGRTFDGAICPINSLAQLLTVDAARSHLRAVAAHLPRGGRYMIQLDLKTPERLQLGVSPPTGAWETGDGTTTVRSRWQIEAFDAAAQVETHLCVIEALTGPRAGEIVSSRDRCRLWRWKDWDALIVSSPFEQTAAYDGNAAGRPPLDVGPSLEGRALAWHELTVG